MATNYNLKHNSISLLMSKLEMLYICAVKLGFTARNSGADKLSQPKIDILHMSNKIKRYVNFNKI